MLNPFALRIGARTLGLLILLAGTLVFALGRPARHAAEEPAPPERVARVAAEPVAPVLPLPRLHAGALRAALVSPPVVEQEALVDGPLALLPPDTVGVLVTASWSDTVRELGLVELLDRYRDRMSDLDHELGEAGLTLDDLVDPSGLGLDAQGPVALAWLDVREPVFVAGMRITDPAAFERALGVLMGAAAEQGGEPFRTEQLGDAVVTFSGGERPELAFLRRGGVAFFVVRDTWQGSVETACAQLAFQDPEQGLPTTREWAETMATVRGQSGAAFLNIPAIKAQVGFAIADSQAQTEESWPEGERPEWAQDQLARLDATRNLSEAFFGSMRGFGVGVELARGRMEVDARLVLEPGSMLEALLRNRGMSSHLQRALDRAPVFLLDGQVDPGVLRQLAGLVASVGGQDLDDLMATAGKAMGLDRDPFTLLSGELGVAVGAPIPDEDSLWSVTVSIGVTDPRAAKDVLDALGAFGSMAGAINLNADLDALSFDVPGWRTLYVAQADRAIIATSDARVIDRLRGGSTASPSGWDVRPEVASVVGATGEAGALMWDFRGLLPGIDEELRWTNHVEVDPELQGPEREMRLLDNKIDDAQRTYSEAIATHRRALVQTLGAVAFSARAEGPSIAVRGGWAYGASNTRELVTLLVETGIAIQDEEDSRAAEVDPLWEQRRALLDEITARQPPPPPVEVPLSQEELSRIGPL